MFADADKIGAEQFRDGLDLGGEAAGSAISSVSGATGVSMATGAWKPSRRPSPAPRFEIMLETAQEALRNAKSFCEKPSPRRYSAFIR